MKTTVTQFIIIVRTKPFSSLLDCLINFNITLLKDGIKRRVFGNID